MKYARIINTVVQEVVDFNPRERFIPQVANLFESVPDTVKVLDIKNANGTWTSYVPPPPPPETPVTPTTIVTKLAFRNRFTQAEKIALYTAADSNVAIKVYLDDVNAATYIDLSRADTISGVQQLELAGIIALGRGNQILTNPVQPEEEWKGGL